MDRSAGLALRWCRAVLLACVSLAVGLIAHVWADGLLPGWPALVALGVVSTVAAAGLLGRPASTLRVVLLLVVGQALIHLVLTASAGHRGDGAQRPVEVAPPRELPDLAHTGRRVGSLHDQLYPDQPVITHLAAPVPVQHVVADLTGPNALMAVAHLLAAAAVGWWLAQGERALWTVVSLTVAGVLELVHAGVVALRVVLHALGALLPEVRRRRLIRHDEPPERSPEPLILARSLTRRGPPALLCA